jgi:serine/threonine protein kinase
MPVQPAETLLMGAVNVTAVPVPVPARIGTWLVQRHLGSGAMGEVFLAQRDAQRAALKLVAKRFAGDDAFIQRFQRETALLATFDHVNVARAFDGGEHEGRPWLAMEYVNGPDLDILLKKHGPFLESEVLNLAMQIGRGLEHIHQFAGLIHRDVKPANILIARAPGGDPHRLLNPGDIAKLIDFGLAKPTEAEGVGLTMTGMIMGTPNYISPEQVACERHLTLHVDMYALGASLYHLLTGRVPFEASSAAAVMAAHLNSQVPDPGHLVPALSPATRKLVMTAMAKRATDRFSDWKAFLVACTKALAGLSEAPAPTSNRVSKNTSVKTVRPASGARSPGPSIAALGGGPALEPRPGSAVPSLGVAGPSTGAEALRAAVTSRIAKDHAGVAPSRSATGRQSNPGQTSAVDRWSGRLEDVGGTGGSILPWIVLTVAVVLAVAGAIWAAVAR